MSVGALQLWIVDKNKGISEQRLQMGEDTSHPKIQGLLSLKLKGIMLVISP